jgi:spore germination protein GerM
VTRRPTIAALVALVAVAALAATGCGGGTQANPETLKADAVPFGLLEEPTSTTPQTTVPEQQYAFVVYFLGDEGAAQVVRTASTKPDPAIVTGALLAGPTREEFQVGLRSAIPRRAIGRVGRVVRRTVTVDLNAPFADVNLSAQKSALTQIVLSLTSLENVGRVRFRLEGEPVSVPRLNGADTAEPVRRVDYLPPDR